ncbi:Hypothetical predicted protein [Paramuricea clavata]|uniref:Uncharacterized protein n=1 Tax=Paramuricea clavata TaxID=317549 RepID=A0A6S7GV24_PARCT|nr:Hypothetical predicted protein [Paramuricea clavata]
MENQLEVEQEDSPGLQLINCKVLWYNAIIRRCVDKKAKTDPEIENTVKKMQCARDKDVGTNAPFVNKSHHFDPVFLELLTPLFNRLSEEVVEGVRTRTFTECGTDVQSTKTEGSSLLRQQQPQQ